MFDILLLIFSKCYKRLNGPKRDTVWIEISCFHDYGQEFALSLLIILKLEETIAKSDRSKEIRTDKIMARKVEISQECQVWFLDHLSINQIS